MVLLFIVTCSILIGSGRADYCQDNFTLAELPGGILIEVVSIVLFGTVNFSGCPENVDVPNSDVKFWYFSRNNPSVPILLDPENPALPFNPSKKTIFLTPGWLCNVTNDRMPQLKDAYLNRYDANVIGIDWSAQSIQLYVNAYCAVPKVAQIIGSFMCFISSTLNVDLSAIHMIGHSMGGQISGYTGQEVQLQCNQIIGRITGLDPAGPLFQGQNPNKRLDSTDAIQVDVIHTNMAILGYFGPCGTVDFYPNCGSNQPGCLNLGNISVSDIINLPVSDVSCDHLRSADYMVESIKFSNSFTSKSCELCPGSPIVGPCVADVENPSFANMGEGCPSNPENTQYYLTTNDKSPFSQG